MSRRWRRSLRWSALAVLLVVAIALAVLWVNRREIADNYIAEELARRGVAATYEIERIGGRRQVLRNIVVGDPARPDLTIERAEIAIRYGFGLPGIAHVTLVKPRVYGVVRDGALSFGALDPLIYTDSDEPFELPDLVLRVEDGRGLIEGDYGPVGLKLSGGGNLSGGFTGELAAVGPRLAAAGCSASGATAYGLVSVTERRPAFAGPVRASSITCPDQGLAVADAAVELSVQTDESMTVYRGEAGLEAGAIDAAEARLASLAGDLGFTWRANELTARYDLTAVGLETAQAEIARLGFDGTLRARRGFERIDLDTDVDGSGIRAGAGVDAALAQAVRATGGTMLDPLLRRIRTQFAEESRDSRLSAELTLRRTGARWGVVVPRATLRGGGGVALLSLSRFQFSREKTGADNFAGTFVTGGADLPRISGSLEDRAAGGTELRLSMDEYSAGTSSLAVPDLAVTRSRSGALGFAGMVHASGPLPGGEAKELRLPVSGNWSSARGLAMWNDCADIRFAELRLANVTLEQHALRLCPPSGTSMVRYGAQGLQVAAGAPSIELNGRLGETPLELASGPIGIAWPGAVSAKQMQITLGPRDGANTFVIEDLTAEVGSQIGGRFNGTDVKLAATPLDIMGASGDWRYADGRLTLSGGAFRMEDRVNPDRFNPLIARDAVLTLENNLITAAALLREPASDRAIGQVDLRHDLSSGSGSADLAVAGILFDGVLQPTMLSELARGIVADVRGTVKGTGRIDWNERGVTSSGRFSSDSLDLAAAFGPVRGASGTVVFTDLVGLTTARDQRIRIASVNPGIEANNGEVVFEMRGGEVLSLKSGVWPFLGGTLTMRPVEIRFGEAEVRRYVLEMEGLDAALFVQRMELNNLSATGTFDGTIPIVFNELGNGHVEGGLLISRPPGGNVSYVGDLTYEDLSPMANFAFDTLRSLDYRQMRVMMDGPLTGEIVTRVRFDGVRQGEGTGESFAARLASRAVSGLPVRFDVNVRAPFYTLLGSVRALYDPAAIRDPRDLGLLDNQGNVIRRETDGEPDPADVIPEQPAIQRRESEEMP